MRAICNPVFKKIVKVPGSIHSRQLMSEIQDSMAEKILQDSFEKCKNTVISLILDGNSYKMDSRSKVQWGSYKFT